VTLIELIEYLQDFDPEHPVKLGFNNPHSYRGYYGDVAFEPVEDTTVGAMLAAAKRALGATFQGWKGGDYVMQEHTDCWLARKGKCGESIGPILLDFMTGRRKA
jgi:hypothetical protein